MENKTVKRGDKKRKTGVRPHRMCDQIISKDKTIAVRLEISVTLSKFETSKNYQPMRGGRVLKP